MSQHSAPALKSPQIVHAHELVRRLGEPLLGGNRVELFTAERVANDALLETLGQAREHINLDSALLFTPGLQTELVDTLVRQSHRGVRVQMLVNAGQTVNSSEALTRLYSAGVAVALRAEERLPWRILDRMSPRMERRLAIADGGVGWMVPSGPTETGVKVRVQGPAVQRLQRLFLESWKLTRVDTFLPRSHYFPQIALAGRHRIGVASSVESGIEHNRPGDAVIGAVQTARHSVRVTLSHRIPPMRLLQALVAARRREVQVSALLPHGATRGALWRSICTRLVEAGISVHEGDQATPQTLSTVDGVWSSLGLGGLEACHGWRARVSGTGGEVIVIDADVARALEQVYTNSLSHATQMNAGSLSRTWPFAVQRSSLPADVSVATRE